MSTGLFYAYAKNINDDYSYRYMITFATRDVADSWWRAVCDSVASGHQTFAGVQRVSMQLYTHNPNVGNIINTVTDARCAGNLLGKVFFTLLYDRDSRILSVAPVLNYTDHISGEMYFVRSTLNPTTFWYYDTSEQVVLASDRRRTKFKIRIEDNRRPPGTIMVGNDDILLTVGLNDTNIGLTTNAERLGPSQRPFRFRFSDFNGGFEIDYESHGSSLGAVVRSPLVGERWELA